MLENTADKYDPVSTRKAIEESWKNEMSLFLPDKIQGAGFSKIIGDIAYAAITPSDPDNRPGFEGKIL